MKELETHDDKEPSSDRPRNSVIQKEQVMADKSRNHPEREENEDRTHAE